MFYVVLVLLILDSFLLAAVVLLQAGQGGGLATLGGGTTDSVLGGRQAVTLLTRLSWWCGGIFLALALVLSILSSNRGVGGRSSLQERLRQGSAPVTAPTPAQLPLQGAPAPAGQQQAPAPTGTTPPATQQPGPSR